ncbi:MAG TPA: DUF962 domain-containing protein [Mizugakiibacter sp.]|nr:DUF962 domain-containing protein [Mizugakiibacter sp.]
MRTLDAWFDRYGNDHRHPVNRTIHWVCVPLLLWSVIALLWALPVPSMIGRNGLWAAVVMFFAFNFYWRLSRRMGLAMLIVLVLLGGLTEILYRPLGAVALAKLAGIVFLATWLGQFIGHTIEGRQPSFLTHLTYLLIGPAWFLSKLLRYVGLNG